MEIQFTRTVNTFFTATIEPDAVEALLDQYRIGETGESLSDRLQEASDMGGDFWVALADLESTETVETETDYTLDEEDAADDEEDDTDDDEEEFDADEFDADDTADLAAHLLAA